MVMDAGIHNLITIPNEFKYFPSISPQNSQSSINSNDYFFSQDFINPVPMPAQQYGFTDPTRFTPQTPISNPSYMIQTPLMNPNNPQIDLHEDPLIFSDITLNFISQMLMEEDIDEKFEEYPGNPNPALLAEAEKPFLEILGSNSISNSIPSPNQPPLPSPNSSDEESFANSLLNYDLIDSNLDNNWSFNLNEFFALNANPTPVLADYYSPSSFSSTNSVSNNSNNVFDVLDQLENESLKAQPVSQFQKGVEEASKFLPNEEKLIIDLESHEFLKPSKPIQIKPEKEEEKENPNNHKGRKHFYELDYDENRSNKHSAGNPEELARDMLDKVLLCNGETCSKGVKELRESLQNVTAKNSNTHSKSSGHTKGRRVRHAKKDVVDLRTLLSHCAQAVATDDRKSAFELLKQLRQHSSEKGDANQRLAHYFADGLEARLAGTGSQIYQSFTMKRIASTDILKAYQLYLAASPFKKISHFFSNQTILDAAQTAKTVHIIDYGIYYGFQWPCLIQRLSNRTGGAPKLRITGIDLPQPGFRPAERVEETGLRLKDYAKRFNVEFEYKAIAAPWESIKIEQLDIKKDELLIVNSLYRFKTLIDESVLVESPRDIVLSTIKKMNPDVFIHGVVNGSYNAPFFVTRFREAIFHFSALFDMLETNVPKEDESRHLLEKALFGREAINVISCEGVERVERPESYKQWQVRNLRAGFKQLPLNEGIMKKAQEKVRNCYHKDFVIDEDHRWLLQGWKGRIVFALSTWRPSQKGR